uniref:hypothetical protein n=1 Tax=Globicatella sulfidifaciens TaxID=136093 RepID=UPI0023F4695B|nr:hypothetical protein [Globicatella sulfidifaciens]
MKAITNYLLKETQHEKEQKALGRFIADIPGISDLPTGHVPQLNDSLFFKIKIFILVNTVVMLNTLNIHIIS